MMKACCITCNAFVEQHGVTTVFRTELLLYSI